MKKLLLLALAACLPFTAALAQDTYDIWYGSLDGSPMSVGINKVILVPAWIKTSADNLADSVAFMHNPLASNDLIIVARTGGVEVPPFSTWDNWSYLAPDADPGGYTNQSSFGFNETGGDPPDIPPVNTNGLPMLLGYYRMTTANDPTLIGTTPCPFQEGIETINGTHLWGNQTGTVGWVPVQHYSCLYFSPNQAPVFDPVGPLTGLEGVPVCFPISATDPDSGNTVTITGPDGFIVEGDSFAAFASGAFCALLPAGTQTLHFEATDGTDIGTLDVEVVVAANALDIEGDAGVSCVLGYPGADVDVKVTLHTYDFLCGGFELLVSWDPTALTYVGADWLPRINSGSEYHNIIPNAAGPGTARFVWIADVNNGSHTSPAYAAYDADFDSSFINLRFHVASGLPFGMEIPVVFLYTGDFTDNTISDSTGYVFATPPSSNGCVSIFDYTYLRGDPNMNCLYYEIADAVLVAQRLIQGTVAWDGDNTDFVYDPSPDCDGNDFHSSAFDAVQEAAADLNDNGFADVGDLVWFINIINGIAFPPKLDPVTGTVGISLNNGVATINSGVEIGAALVRLEGDITPVANGMDMLVGKSDGMTSVLIYSLASARIPAGTNTLFTYTGEGTIVEVSAADAYGRLLDASARPALPTQFAVQQNYPNPFNAKTLISFDLPVSSDVTISIYNIAGQLVESISGNYEAGHQQVTWDASGVASGVYFAKVAAGDKAQTVKMTMLK
ncbi:MAG: hypothetical protein A2W25_00495 [candidate division Zixibacteria bacterium RBG_16_53_22]|nr:MAG: hypothetical protein A2W25_00495 [candidate division Zixibacteria bacterium RBG_16_53_22]